MAKKSQSEIMKYIYDWLVGLNIGPVFQDRKPFGDTTKLRSIRTYIVFEFQNGIDDLNAFYHGECTVYIGCRDEKKFVADMNVLDKACKVFLNEFEKNDEAEGMHCLDVEQVDYYSDEVGNHEYQFIFDVFADKDVEFGN